MIESLNIKSKVREELIDISQQVRAIVRAASFQQGLCVIYTPHTTAAITINENADPAVPFDIIKGLSTLALEQVSYKHAEGNSPAHIKSSLVGCSETILVDDGKLQLGTWQGIFFCEFDGPRHRTVLIKLIAG